MRGGGTASRLAWKLWAARKTPHHPAPCTAAATTTATTTTTHPLTHSPTHPLTHPPTHAPPQILGAEKALFRALKTKGNTPKYGLIFHSSFIGRAKQKNKGRISRCAAAAAGAAAWGRCCWGRGLGLAPGAAAWGWPGAGLGLAWGWPGAGLGLAWGCWSRPCWLPGLPLGVAAWLICTLHCQPACCTAKGGQRR